MAAKEELDTFYVLTALLVTPAQFPSVLGDDYPEACATLGVEPWSDGYGLLFGQDASGARWTVVCDDAALVAGAIAAWDCGMEYELAAPDRTVVDTVAGWPLAITIATPDIPAPHDPHGDHPVLLQAPDPQGWGPAHRRLAADEVAKQWLTWRHQVSEGASFDSTGAQPPAHVKRALDQARGYTSDPPPAGRIRSAPAPDGARIVRADGPGWSLAAHTEDIALLLLDEKPHEIIPVGRGPELPALLRDLDQMARASG
ncbi:hypothetical protein [Streptacidiphilus fuscans]|uniref:Integral membrane protein n=1 Tax=Streptacidiphilus fuscans TaxID=2789292 RepID=A0A931FDZ4_9ACTN|nr:hypothetical protein [Streptacidiphilus fuscans]MBF9070098.1 hypothetical protein [Streptacidiphilus fuscans]